MFRSTLNCDEAGSDSIFFKLIDLDILKDYACLKVGIELFPLTNIIYIISQTKPRMVKGFGLYTTTPLSV